MSRPVAWISAVALAFVSTAFGCTQPVVPALGSGGDSGTSEPTPDGGTSSQPDPNQQAQEALAALQPSITSVYFTPASSIDSNPPPSHVIFQQDPGVARDMFRATVELPLYDGSPESCTEDWGITYTLEFFAGETSVAKVVLHPNGCFLGQFTNGVTVSEADPDPDTYFRILAAGLGIVESDIYPYSPPEPGGG
ncbi:MAG: hypothetical protein ACRELY_19205 [Polyangiaceae bacterium]